MNAGEFLTKENMKKILLLCFLVILMFVAIENIGVIFKYLGKLIDLIFPFILGCAIAFVFNVPMKKIEGSLFKKNPQFKGKRVISYLISLLLIIGIIVVVLFVLIPELIETVKQLSTQVPVAFAELQKFIKYANKRWPELASIINTTEFDYEAIIKKIGKMLSSASGILNSTVGVVTSIISGFTTFFIGFVFSIYLLFRKEELSRQFKKVLYALLPQKKVSKILEIGNLSNVTFSNFITGQCLEACILGMMFFITMTLMQMPYTVLISVLITVTALIPIFGAFIGCIVGFLLILIVSTKQAIIFIITFLILQQIEGNLIYPHVVGNSVGLPSIWVLVAITIGGNLMGVVGMIVFIPLCSVLYALFREYINKRIDKRNIPAEKYSASFKTLEAEKESIRPSVEVVALTSKKDELN